MPRSLSSLLVVVSLSTADAHAIYKTVGEFVTKNLATSLHPEWNGYNVLQRAASHSGAFDVGFVPPSAEVAAKTEPKLLWLSRC